jgi:hypothetical protein
MIYELVTAEYPADRAHFQPFIYLSATLLSMLVLMHTLWFYMFQRLNLAHLRNHKNLDEVMHIGGVTPPSKGSTKGSDPKKSN